MLGGLTSVATLPSVLSVSFTNAERTQAAATIRTYFSGGELFLEKAGGTWRVASVGATYVN